MEPNLKAEYNFKAVVMLIFLSTMPYLNTLPNGFVYDDNTLIVENVQLREPYNIVKFIQSTRGVKKIIHLVLYQLWGLNPLVFHLASIILHVICTLSLYILLKMMFKSSNIPLITGLLFAAHPVHTEAIAAISNMNDPLAMFFFVWSFILYLKRDESKWFYFFSIASFLLSLLSKEGAAITLPIMLLVYDLLFAKGDNKRYLIGLNPLSYLPYYAVLFIIVALMFMFNIYPTNLQPARLFHQTISTFYTAIGALPVYIKLLFLPINLNVEHVIPVSESILEFKVLASLTFLFILFIAAIKLSKVSKVITFGSVWFFITYFPVSNLIFKVTPYFVAERYLYLPSIGFCLIIATFIDKGMKVKNVFLLKYPLKDLTIYILIIMLGLYSGLTINRNLDWKSNFTLWSRTVRQSPRSDRAHHGLGEAYRELGLLDNAAIEYKKALIINNNNVLAHNNLGNIYLAKRLIDNAIDEYTLVVIIDPSNLYAHYNLGLAYDRKGFYKKAIKHYKMFLELTSKNHTSFQEPITNAKKRISVLKGFIKKTSNRREGGY